MPQTAPSRTLRSETAVGAPAAAPRGATGPRALPASVEGPGRRAPAAAGRQISIDAARGGAMFFVCLSHFADAYFPIGGSVHGAIERVGMVASPTFVLMSGLMLGFLFHMQRGPTESLRDRLVDRGLFQLLVGHVVMTLAGLHPPYDLATALAHTQVTDVVGVALIVGAVVVPRVGAARRLALGVAVYAGQAAIAGQWSPAGATEQLAYAVLLGPAPGGELVSAFALLPWLGWSLVGTALGSYVAGCAREGAIGAAGRTMVRVGGAAMLVAVACKGAYHALKTWGVIAPDDTLFWLTYPWGKYPPSPAYLLLYGGAGCAALGALVLVDARGQARAALAALAAVGRASWPVFVVQCFVYTTVRWVVQPAPSAALAPLVFAATLVPSIVVARWWSARDYNRLLTVGYGRRRDAAGTPAPAPGYATIPAAVALYPAPDRGRRVRA